MGIKGKFADLIDVNARSDRSFTENCQDVSIAMIDATQTFHRIVTRPIGKRVEDAFPDIEACIEESVVLGEIEEKYWRDGKGKDVVNAYQRFSVQDVIFAFLDDVLGYVDQVVCSQKKTQPENPLTAVILFVDGAAPFAKIAELKRRKEKRGNTVLTSVRKFSKLDKETEAKAALKGTTVCRDERGNYLGLVESFISSREHRASVLSGLPSTFRHKDGRYARDYAVYMFTGAGLKIDSFGRDWCRLFPPERPSNWCTDFESFLPERNVYSEADILFGVVHDIVRFRTNVPSSNILVETCDSDCLITLTAMQSDALLVRKRNEVSYRIGGWSRSTLESPSVCLNFLIAASFLGSDYHGHVHGVGPTIQKRMFVDRYTFPFVDLVNVRGTKTITSVKDVQDEAIAEWHAELAKYDDLFCFRFGDSIVPFRYKEENNQVYAENLIAMASKSWIARVTKNVADKTMLDRLIRQNFFFLEYMTITRSRIDDRLRDFPQLRRKYGFD